MASVEQRLQMKREPLDKWSVREKLCLVSAVVKIGDQNWMSVSRVLKPFADPNRPPDWFHQKNCAAQYGALLASVETPKRKKRTSGSESGMETPSEYLLRQLKEERLIELNLLLAEEKAEYLKMQEELSLMSSGKVKEEQLDAWLKEIDDEEAQQEQDALRHAQWLKEREMRKQEIERAWRPPKITPQMTTPKRQNSDSLDSFVEVEQHQLEDSNSNSTPSSIIQESPKPLALSPLLTSLLKSPSQVQNIGQSLILHSAITNQRPSIVTSSNGSHVSTNTVTNPMIASLLNSTNNVAVSPGIQNLVNNTIVQSAENTPLDINQQSLATPDILDDETLRNLKIEEIANSIIVPDGPLPEMKNDVDVIISDLIADPDQHLQLDNNGDININLELDDLEEEEGDPDLEKPMDTENVKIEEKCLPVIDPFEFQEDPEYEPKVPMKTPDQNKQPPNLQSPIPIQIEDKEAHDTESIEVVEMKPTEVESPETGFPSTAEIAEKVIGTVEDCELSNTSDVQGTVQSPNVEEQPVVVKEEEEKPEEPVTEIVEAEEEVKKDVDINIEVAEETVVHFTSEDNTEPIKQDEKECNEKIEEETVKQDISLSSEIDIRESTEDPNLSDEIYDDIQMEVQARNVGKAKRDYSRTKKKEENNFDILLAIEKAHREERELLEDLSDVDIRRKDEVKKEDIKSENEKSSSSWTEEDDASNSQTKRVISTPVTPLDSIPNSPASSSLYCEDDKEYRIWKKSILLCYSGLLAHKCSSLFMKPITEDQAPGYHGLIYRPMDLQTIRKNIENGVIRTTEEFKRDLMLMLNNAIMFNKTNGTVYNMTREFQLEAMKSIQLLLEAQAAGDEQPLRRETRTSEPGFKRKRGAD